VYLRSSAADKTCVVYLRFTIYDLRFTMLLMSAPFIEENDQTRARKEHLEALRQLVGNPYPNKFERSRTVEPQREDTITTLVEKYRAFEPEVSEGGRPAPEAVELANQQLNAVTVRVAGRIASPPRVMGKAAFVHLSDGVTRIQIYVKRADVTGVSNAGGGGEVDGWELFNLLDHGDFIGVEGYLFITKTGELSIHVQKLQFLAKALLPLPDKMHGIHDPEIRQRQRYADLIAGSLKLEHEENDLTPREVFERRSKIISEMRRILEDHGYVEVETPMLTSKATGAAARAFETHHNALDITLYARIAPELYLKRLLVGGFEKVYELNRNFRNEGIDRTHNPEFTMLEFYWAYADVNQMMDFCEEMLRATVFTVLGHTHVHYGEYEIDFGQPFQRLTMREAVARFAPDQEITEQNLLALFEEQVEHRLIQPTLIYDFPKVVSPLSKASPANPFIAERFELFITGMECANGFSELNDPAEQYQRFLEQMSQRDRGNEEAMVMDEDYIRALSYGMPPAAGIGIGIDRFVMLLTNKQSIRDVILFPHMRPERKAGEGEAEPELDKEQSAESGA
jgi:lysyl-tRNA synthetase class 2